MSVVVLSDRTRYVVNDITHVWRRDPPKPYRGKANRKQWKRARQRAAHLR